MAFSLSVLFQQCSILIYLSIIDNWEFLYIIHLKEACCRHFRFKISGRRSFFYLRYTSQLIFRFSVVVLHCPFHCLFLQSYYLDILLSASVSCTSARFAKLILRTTLVAYNFADPQNEGETILGNVGTPYPSSRPNLTVGLNFQHLCYENLHSRDIRTLIFLLLSFMPSILGAGKWSTSPSCRITKRTSAWAHAILRFSRVFWVPPEEYLQTVNH
jgi:hypothetical protein